MGRPSKAGGCAPCASETCRRSCGRERIEAAGRVVDVAFGGAFYASLEERVDPGELPRPIALGRELKAAIEAEHDVVHPLEPELRDVYGVIFWQHERDDPLTQRNVTVFADGEVDRSPCGSGTSAGSPCSTRRAGFRAATSSAISDHRLRVQGPRRGPGGRRGLTRGDRRGRGLGPPDGQRPFELAPDDPFGEGFLLR